MDKILETAIPVSGSKEALELGEGPVWDKDTKTLLYIDVNTGRIIEADLSGRHIRTCQLPDRVGAAVLTSQNGILLAACGLGQVLVKRDAGKSQWGLRTFGEPLPEVFTIWNDGKVAPGGDYFFVGTKYGTCNSALAGFYRFDKNGNRRQVFDGRTVSNGLDWSKDETEMYYIDSADKRVVAYGYESRVGRVVRNKVRVVYDFFNLPPAEDMPCAVPDGMCVDSKGNLYVAIYGGGCVMKISPEGDNLGKIQLWEAAKPTSCCFAGEDLKTLVITTAIDADGADRQALLKRYPKSGLVHTCELKIPGRCPDRFNFIV